MPMPSGESKATQIEEGDLFDFDLEVIPIVEVLVGKTLEQAIMQVLEEKELSELRKHQEQFEQLRNVELAETQRLEARETRLFEEKQRRKRQEQERVDREEELARKIASRTVSKQYLSGLQSSVFQHLSRVGHFTDPLVQQVENEFMPWLGEQVMTIASLCPILSYPIPHRQRAGGNACPRASRCASCHRMYLRRCDPCGHTIISIRAQ